MRLFSKNRALSLLSPYGPLNTCTISKKSLERILRKSVTDFVKGKLVTFDAEKRFIAKMHLTWSGRGVRRLPT